MKFPLRAVGAAAAAFALAASTALANEPEIVDARATRTAANDDVETWRFDVTVRHADEGWDHYADAYEILSLEGEVLGVRALAHPHVNEQPFTRSVSGVEIPAGTERVQIRARDTVHGYGAAMAFTLERPE